MRTTTIRKLATALIGALALTAIVTHAQDKPKSAVLITNARIFDGKSDKLTAPTSVLVEGNKIAKIAASIPAPAGATVIDAGGQWCCAYRRRCGVGA